MNTLIENLYNNNVIFSYYGFIDNTVLGQVLQITRSKLESNNESLVIVDKVHNTISECVENVIRHNFYPDDSRVHYKSLIVVSKQNDAYLIDSINVINAEQKEIINEQLSYLHSKSHEELLELKSRTILHDNSAVAVNSGLVDLVLKADDCDCTFKDLETNYLFNINFKINSPN